MLVIIIVFCGIWLTRWFTGFLRARHGKIVMILHEVVQ